jgi:hypothetical protein
MGNTFDFVGKFGPPNQTVAPQHLAVCVVYDDQGRPSFGSYVVYPPEERLGTSRSHRLTGQPKLVRENHWSI